MTFATRIEVNNLCRSLAETVGHCSVIRTANLYYVRLNRRAAPAVVLMQWSKLTKAEARAYGMPSDFFKKDDLS